MLIAHVALPVPLYQLFDYKLTIPAEIGMRVRVPFGKREMIGIIVKIDQQTTFDIENLKSITTIIDTKTPFPQPIWQLLNWATSYYHFPIGEVMNFL